MQFPQIHSRLHFFQGNYAARRMHWLKRKVKRKSGEKIFTLHLSMQRKHHKCKVLKVIGSEEKKKHYMFSTKQVGQQKKQKKQVGQSKL